MKTIPTPGEMVNYAGKARKVVSVNMGGKVKLRGVREMVDVDEVTTISNKRTVKVVVSIDVETNKTTEQVLAAVRKGIYMGLDRPPVYIAMPSDVKINYCQER